MTCDIEVLTDLVKLEKESILERLCFLPTTSHITYHHTLHITHHTLYITHHTYLMSNNLVIEHFQQSIAVQLEEVMNVRGGLGRITSLCPPKPVADDTIKLLIRNQAGQANAVIICSSPVAPDLVARGLEQMQRVRTILSPKLRQVILHPLLTGEWNGLTYMVLPYHSPLSRFRLRRLIQRWYLRPRILEWLRQATQETLRQPSPEEIQIDFLLPLVNLVANQQLPEPLHQGARNAVQRLQMGLWQPQYVLAHNDFWIGNLLLSNANDFGFVIIDWPGAKTNGHAIYDLLRLAQSLQLSAHQLFDELQQHCQILGCSPLDARGYLLANLGYLGMHLENFPMAQYVTLVERCYYLLEHTNLRFLHND